MNTGAMLYSLNKIRSQITATARYLDGLIQQIEQEKPSFWSVYGADPRKIREEILGHHGMDEHDAFDNMPPILERELRGEAGIRSRRPLVGPSGKHLRKILTTNPIKYRRKGHTRHRCPEPCGRGFIGRQNQVYHSVACGVAARRRAATATQAKTPGKRGR